MKAHINVTTLGVTFLLAASISAQVHAQSSSDSSAECTPLKAQYPDLGTSFSVSAVRDFPTSWASLELPGGTCGHASAQAHYEALLADAERRGGPTAHTRTSLPDWGGHWGTDNRGGEAVLLGRGSTREGMAARLTPEARAVYLSDLEYWDTDRAIDPLAMCLPPNFPRWFSVYGYREHFLTPDKSLLGSEMMNEFRRVFTDGRSHPSDEWMTNEWLGYSIGFWDDDILTIWTKGIKEGVMSREMPRLSNALETIERWRRVAPIKEGELGRIEIELTMYDTNLVEPWHTVAAFYLEDESTPELREQVWPHLWSCTEGSNWYVTADGVISQYAPGEKPDITNPDYWFDEAYTHD